jgi:hypothetical protein
MVRCAKVKKCSDGALQHGKPIKAFPPHSALQLA